MAKNFYSTRLVNHLLAQNNKKMKRNKNVFYKFIFKL